MNLDRLLDRWVFSSQSLLRGTSKFSYGFEGGMYGASANAEGCAFLKFGLDRFALEWYGEGASAPGWLGTG